MAASQQKLVTIYLDAFEQRAKHGTVSEHLAEELTAGWKIASVTAMGGVEGFARGYLAVVLEKK